ncbi:cation-translocating P-type ATPase [Candidatus Peribacteria bacterium]|nr:cation-translocating P-type ATPase [Candidatus Peribacteria bacterium]
MKPQIPTSPKPFFDTVFHAVSSAEACRVLGADPHRGLSPEQARHRSEIYGVNALLVTKKASPFKILFAQFCNVLTVILLLGAGVSAALGHAVEAVTIAVIVVFSVLLGFIQEFRAEKAIDALKRMAAPSAIILRDGEEMDVPAEEIVPGDMVILTTGDRVPADGRVVLSVNMQTDEAAMTGESLPVEKDAHATISEKASLGDRRTMVYAGTSVSYGRGTAVVTATGMHTEFGAIAGMLSTVETAETPLQKSLDRMGHHLARAAFVIIAIIAGLGLMRGQPIIEVLLFGIALAVAVVPEALPAVVTISLAIGVQRMVRRHALIRRLPAVETLGCTSVICSDKTGTLTKDQMTVRKVFVGDNFIDVTGAGYEPHGSFLLGEKEITPDALLIELLQAGALASDARLTHIEGDGWTVRGDPTEGALIAVAAKAGLKKEALDERFPRIAEIPFTSESKRMTTIHSVDGPDIAYTKGAPEIVLSACTGIRTEKGYAMLSPDDRERILSAAQTMAGKALRVLAVASKEGDDVATAQKDMTFLGLLGMIDPPRPDAADAVMRCKSAGISVIMITGDHPVTAQAIAKELGILDGGRAVTGSDLDAMDDAELAGSVMDIDVFARVSPSHKLRIVSSLQGLGHTVAMTGDGVNDAPALKKADIGVAMGINGTDVTREAAAMTLTDDNFASIVAAVEEGRQIFANIHKYLLYLLSSNTGEIVLMTAATLAGVPLPLTAAQILYVNLATDGLPALALSVEPPEEDLMRKPPRSSRSGIFSRRTLTLMVLGGAWSATVNLGLFLWALSSGRPLPEAMTMVFASLCMIEFLKAYCFRSDRSSIFRRPFANRWLNLATLSSMLLLACVMYVPFFQGPFKTVALPADDLLFITLAALSVVPVLEIGKILTCRWMPER